MPETGGRMFELNPDALYRWRGTETTADERFVPCPVVDVLLSFWATPYVYCSVADFCCC